AQRVGNLLLQIAQIPALRSDATLPTGIVPRSDEQPRLLARFDLKDDFVHATASARKAPKPAGPRVEPAPAKGSYSHSWPALPVSSPARSTAARNPETRPAPRRD